MAYQWPQQAELHPARGTAPKPDKAPSGGPLKLPGGQISSFLLVLRMVHLLRQDRSPLLKAVRTFKHGRKGIKQGLREKLAFRGSCDRGNVFQERSDRRRQIQRKTVTRGRCWGGCRLGCGRHGFICYPRDYHRVPHTLAPKASKVNQKHADIRPDAHFTGLEAIPSTCHEDLFYMGQAPRPRGPAAAAPQRGPPGRAPGPNKQQMNQC